MRFTDNYGSRAKTAQSLVAEAWQRLMDATARRSSAIAHEVMATLGEAAQVAKTPRDKALVEESRKKALATLGPLLSSAKVSRPTVPARAREAQAAMKDAGACSVCGDPTDHGGDGHPSYDVEDEDAARAQARRLEALAARRTRGIF